MNDLRSCVTRLSAAALRLKRSAPASGPFHLALLTDDRISDRIEAVVRLLPEGAAVIFRQYQAPMRARQGRRLAGLCAARRVLFYVAGDISLARRIGADGVHLPARHMSRNLNTDGLLVSAACHCLAEIKDAEAIGAHSIFLSPVFATASHPGADYLGVQRFRRLAARASMPVIALGGINGRNADRLLGAGAAGLGAIDGFFNSDRDA